MKENEDIRDYFRLCIKNIDRDNLYMLRKVCMYISMVYLLMYVLAVIVLPNFEMTWIYYLVLPLICVYFFINLYTRKKTTVLSTNTVGNLCGVFYFLMCLIFILMDVFGTSGSMALWTPISMIVFPMVYIDRMFKYGIELLVIICIYTPLAYFNKDIVAFKYDMHIVLAAYIISMICAHIILVMRSKAGLAMIELQQMSSIDKLTHVLNKGALLQKIENFYEKKDPDAACAMIIVDVDDFKQVNDNLGHDTGDMLLEKVGNLLINSFRAYDIIGRYGGDEFVVMLPTMSDAVILEKRCRNMQEFLSDVRLGNGQPFSVSIGAVIDQGGHTSADMFRMADDALYKSKMSGKNCCTTWIAKNTLINTEESIIIGVVKNGDILSKLGDVIKEYSVYTVNNVEDALRSISQYRSRIQAVVVDMDVELESDGMIIRYIKSREGFAGIPVLAVASTDEASRKARKLGADKVHKSEVSLEKLKTTITKLIQMEKI